MIYLDNNATTQPAPEAVDAMLDALRENWHNPSSIHRAGQAARRHVERARSSVARLLNARPRQIVFTSGGTEAIDWTIRGLLERRQSDHRNVIVTTPIEHSAVGSLVRSLEEQGEAEVRWAPVSRAGVVDADALADLLDDQVALVSVQWANNETGAIQPIHAVGELCRSRNIPFHCDGAQWVGKMPTDFAQTPIDVLTIAAHKFHGPKGVGALCLRRGIVLPPRILGSQENGQRGGTENVPGIVGFGAAAEVAAVWLKDEQDRARIQAMRNRLEQGIIERVPDGVINGPSGNADRLWNTSNIGFPSVQSEALLIALSERGVCASAGAACSSGSLEPSPVLLAMEIPETIAHGSLRFSLSRNTTESEIDQTINIVVDCVERIRQSTEALA